LTGIQIQSIRAFVCNSSTARYRGGDGDDSLGIQANVVAIDNIRAIKKAVTYLINNGHSKIVHFAGSPQSSHTQERIEEFRNAFSESTLAFDK
jgi:DNA-binding LacI/PurR family transcriptional regulator